MDISYGTIFSLPHSALWTSKIHICPTIEIHSSHSDIPESQPIAASSPESHLNIISSKVQKSHHLNQVEVRLWVWSILGKNFYLCAWETWKRVMCSQTTVVDMQNMTVMDVPKSKKEEIQGISVSLVPGSFEFSRENFSGCNAWK